jgi:hypothetical protein
MPTFKVLGKIEPPWIQLTFDIEPQVRYRIDEVALDLSCKISIKQSDVLVTCEASRFDEGTMAWALQYLFDWVSAEVDLFTFASGKVFNVHLDSAEYPDGSIHRLIGTAPDLAALVTACTATSTDDSVHVDIRALLTIIIGSPTLMIALHDLTSALRYGNNSLTNCGRAMEGLRKALWGKDEADDREQQGAWKKLRDTLRVSKPYLQTITNASRGPRHGSTAYIAGNHRQDVLKKSWTVMNRFLQYRLGGDQPLLGSEYPML